MQHNLLCMFTLSTPANVLLQDHLLVHSVNTMHKKEKSSYASLSKNGPLYTIEFLTALSALVINYKKFSNKQQYYSCNKHDPSHNVCNKSTCTEL